MIIRCYDDMSTQIKFDGVEGEWLFTTLEGPYGPVDRYDLFIGAKIKVFGRHLTISSANATVCHWIDQQSKKLEHKIKWLQEKIEKVGSVPIIRRDAPKVMRHITRSEKAAGYQNLRKLKIDLAKLGEQLSELGLSHLVGSSKGGI